MEVPMEVIPFDLIGKRVRLAPMNESHIAGLCEAGTDPTGKVDPRIWTYMPVRVQSAQDIASHMRAGISAIATGAELPFTIFDLETGRIVGSTRYLDITPAHKALEIGWTWLNPSVWRTRVNTECKYLLLRYAFKVVGAIRVQFKADARNTRSLEAMERIGAIREGVLRHHRIMPDGYLRDSVYYSILDSEWPDVKKRLEEFLGQ